MRMLEVPWTKTKKCSLCAATHFSNWESSSAYCGECTAESLSSKRQSFEQDNWVPLEFAQRCVELLDLDEGAVVYAFILSWRCSMSRMSFESHQELLFLAICLVACKLHLDDPLPSFEFAQLGAFSVDHLLLAESYVFKWLLVRSELFVRRDDYIEASKIMRESAHYSQLLLHLDVAEPALHFM